MKEKLHWIRNIKKFLESNGMMSSFANPTINLSGKVFQRASDIFHQEAFASIKSERSKLRTYSKIKHCIGFENYLNDVTNISDRIAMTKLRLSNHKLMIEAGRHTKLDINMRLCPNCMVLESEIHFLFSCSLYTELRILLLSPFLRNRIYTDDEKLIIIFSSRNFSKNIAKYINASFCIRESLQVAFK